VDAAATGSSRHHHSVTGSEELARRFDEHRDHLRSVAYRLLGSFAEADDAVQETWLRLSRADATAIGSLAGWLTTVTARVCLDLLRARRSRREQPLDPAHLPDPLISDAYDEADAGDTADPQHRVALADTVGLALLVVLDTLAPAERIAFVLHDVFAVPFEDIAPIVDRSPAAARKLASRARHRVRASAPHPDPDLPRQWRAMDAFLAAARDGDFGALIAVLDPDVVLRADAGAVPAGASRWLRGARVVAEQALSFAWRADLARRVLVNGGAGLLVAVDRQLIAILAITVTDGRIVEIDILADRARLARLDLPARSPQLP
jgi:RNA polymerase sigma factor (sigma-70 family)